MQKIVNKQSLQNVMKILLWIIFIATSISLVRSTKGQGTDFLVFWRTGVSLLQGKNFYELSAGGMVFKYPPWIAPWFALVGLFTFETAKWIWGFFCLFCLYGIFWTLEKRYQMKRAAWAMVAALYWGIWVIHFLDGQVIIPLLLVSLFLHPSVPYFLTTKIFTLFPVATLPRKFFNFKSIALTLLLLVLLTSLSAFACFNGHFLEMFKAWTQAAASGAQYLAPGQTRGPKNQSLTALLCRCLEVPATSTLLESEIAIGFYAVAWTVLRFFRRLNETQVWFTALAIVPIFHPLPWQHLYVFVFPLAVYGMNECIKANTPRVSRAWYFLGLFLLTLSNGRAIGPIGYFLENSMGRAWGALILVAWMLNHSMQNSVQKDPVAQDVSSLA
jgi:hypothetical protein